MKGDLMNKMATKKDKNQGLKATTDIQKQSTGEEGVAEHRGLRQTKGSTSENLIPCQQKQCGFLISGEGCRACDTCKAEPFKINDKCNTCFDCEFKPGFVRWDDDGEKKRHQAEFAKFLDGLKTEFERQEKIYDIKPIEIKPIEISQHKNDN
jgi:hypothetical protein